METSQKSIETLNGLRNDSFLREQYEMQEVLGEGCFGKIVKAKNKTTSKLIALKLEKFKKSKIKMVLKN